MDSRSLKITWFTRNGKYTADKEKNKRTKKAAEKRFHKTKVNNSQEMATKRRNRDEMHDLWRSHMPQFIGKNERLFSPLVFPRWFLLSCVYTKWPHEARINRLRLITCIKSPSYGCLSCVMNVQNQLFPIVKVISSLQIVIFGDPFYLFFTFLLSFSTFFIQYLETSKIIHKTGSRQRRTWTREMCFAMSYCANVQLFSIEQSRSSTAPNRWHCYRRSHCVLSNRIYI